MVSTGGTPVLFFIFSYPGCGHTVRMSQRRAILWRITWVPGAPLAGGADPCIPSDIQQVAIYLQCTVCLMGQYAFCQNLTQLYAFLIEAVYIPCKALEHNLIFKMCKQCTQSFRGQLVADDNPGT